MSLFNSIVNAILGVSPTWSSNDNSAILQVDDPIQVASAWFEKRNSDARSRVKDQFETTSEHRERLRAFDEKARARRQSLDCYFLLELDDPCTYDADSRYAFLRTRPLEFSVGLQRYDRLLLAEVHTSSGGYSLQNYFGAERSGEYRQSTHYVFQIANLRELAAFRKPRRKKDMWYLDHTHNNELLGARFPIDREYARAELSVLCLVAQVCVKDISTYGYTYGGDTLDVPDTHHRTWTILQGQVLALNVVNIRTRQVLGSWEIRQKL